MRTFWIICWVLFLVGVAASWTALGFAGIDLRFGLWWAVSAIGLLALFNFAVPIAIGVYFGATDLLGLHWAIALILAAPVAAAMLMGASLQSITGPLRGIGSKKTH